MKEKNVLKNKEINPNQFYSLLQVQKFTGIKSRQYLSKYVKDGLLRAITVDKGSSMRYAIKGEWALSFIERWKKGLVKGEKYTIPELKLILEGAVKFCQENKIKTLRELTNKIKSL